MFGKGTSAKNTPPSVGPKPLRILGYGFPPTRGDDPTGVIEGNGVVIHHVSLPSAVSFLDFDGVVQFAATHMLYWGGSLEGNALEADLDLREREFFTAIKKNVPFIFLVPRIPRNAFDPHGLDLFNRIARKLEIYPQDMPNAHPALDSSIPEFREYIHRHGTGYAIFAYPTLMKTTVTPICAAGQYTYGLIVAQNVYILPCTDPQNVQQITEMASAAVSAVLAYRRRISTKLPEWIGSYAFGKEQDLMRQAETLRAQLLAFEEQINAYTAYKGVLAYQSDPLVKVVCRIFDEFCGIQLTVDEKCVEDATLRTQTGTIEAIFEIKGVKGDFKRSNVNQIDSHRERLNLSHATPGVLIMNTFMEAASLAEKDQSPHPDIIKKAVADHVLMIRTLDLLRFADAVERGAILRSEMSNLLLSEAGWLKVEGDKYKVIKG